MKKLSAAFALMIAALMLTLSPGIHGQQRRFSVVEATIPQMQEAMAKKQVTRQNYDAPPVNPLGALYSAGETGRIHGQPPEARTQ